MSQVLSRFFRRSLVDRIIKTPYMADSITQGTLASWEKKIGEFVAQDETVANIETDKVTIPVNAPESGVIKDQFAKEGDTVQVGSDLFKLELGAGNQKKDQSFPGAVKSSTAEHQTSSSTSTSTSTPLPKEESTFKKDGKKESPSIKGETAKPSVGKPGISNNVFDNIATVASPLGNIMSTSKSSSSTINEKEDKKAIIMPSSLKASSTLSERIEVTESLSRMRIRIAERMKQSQEINAALTTFNEVDMHALMSMRSKYKELFSEKNDGLKLGFMSAFVKACSRALWEWPIVNARMDLNTKEVVYHNYVDISVAVATPKVHITIILINSLLSSSFYYIIL